MDVTGRFWAAGGVAAVLATAGASFGRLSLLIGGLGVSAFVLAHQLRFVRELQRLETDLEIRQRTADDEVLAGEDASLSLKARLQRETSLALRITPNTPLATSVAEPTAVSLGGATRRDETVLSITTDTAGEYTIDRPTVAVTDEAGFFTTTFRSGPTATLVVAPRRRGRSTLGSSTDRTADISGTRADALYESIGGDEPFTLQEYTPGDPASRIDWKAKARLGELYVRVPESWTQRSVTVLLDHRASLAAGRPGGSKLDYARDVALTILAEARERSVPLGAYLVGERGVTERWLPKASSSHYGAVQSRIRKVQPTGTADSDASRPRFRSPSETHRVANQLRHDDSEFGRTLRPYFGAAPGYVERIDEDPLFTTVESVSRELRGESTLVVVTDDTRDVELLESVRNGRRVCDRVLVFVALTAAFEGGDTARFDSPREARGDSLLRTLRRMSGVEAFGITPHRSDDVAPVAQRVDVGGGLDG